MAIFESNSIKKRLTWMSMLASSSAMLLACSAFVVFELIAYPMMMVRMLTVRAQIVGSNSVSALTFADQRSAEATLASLKADPHIVWAGLYGRDGKLFAGYRRAGGQDPPPAALPETPRNSHRFESSRLLLSHDITFEGERVGAVLFQSDLAELYADLAKFGLLGGAILAVSVLLAFLISGRLQRPISETVLHLAETARAVSHKRDYSVRAAPSKTRDELELLTGTFNEMLSQIEQRSASLEQARQDVELRVEERTSELRQSEERFRLMVDGVKDYAIFMLDPTGRVTSWNEGAERMKGYRAEEIVGQYFSCFYQPEDVERGKPEMALRTAVAEGRFDERGWQIRKDGSRFWTNTLITALFDLQGRLIGFSEITRDLNERKRSEDAIRELNEGLQARTAELERMNKELESFTYSVSHDLRAPLRHIDGFSKLLLEEHGEVLPEEGREYLTLIRDGTKEMSQLVDDLLNLARIGRKELSLQVAGLDALVAEVRGGLKTECAKRAIEWKVQPLPFVECDPALMKQVLSNLLSNAVKYSRRRDPAVIEVGSFQQDKQFVVFVRDNGVGFDMKHVNKLFGVFQRLHRQEDFEGTGIGLAIVQRIIHKHGGRIWAEAELNKGAAFYFTLGAPGEPSAKIQAAEESLIYGG